MAWIKIDKIGYKLYNMRSGVRKGRPAVVFEEIEGIDRM